MSDMLKTARRPRMISEQEAEQANQDWGCNCGPAAIAAVVGLPLREMPKHVPGFAHKRYTSPMMMWAALRSIPVQFSYRGGHLGCRGWPRYGLARIQWEGPWMRPGVPAAAAYGRTHWVGADARNPANIGIFDINAVANGTGWCSADDWATDIAPWIIGHTPRADGGWHITHAVEVV